MYDVVVVGLGAMGASALEHLSRAGLKVLGIEQFESPHTRGSSHGETRIIRQAYFEDPRYVPLLQRAYTLWQNLEQRAGESLLHLTGGLMLGPEDGELIQGTLNSVRTHDLPHSYHGPSAWQDNPLWQVPEGYAGVYEQQAGYLLPERCIASQLRLAAAQGAEVWQNTAVQSWQHATDVKPVVIHTDRGEVHTHKLILSTGAWMPHTYAPAREELQVTRQSLFWFAPPAASREALADLPIFLLEMAPTAFLYGFPLQDERFKVALHQPGPVLAPEALPQQRVSESEIEDMAHWLSRYFKVPMGPCVQTTVCMYTNTPDGHFRWYTHPEQPEVLALSACSGHGFKFASVMGELCAQWAVNAPIPYDLGLFTGQLG